MIGEILGNRYKILRDLGSGGMAWVYLAQDSLEGGTVAVKVLYPQFSLDMAYLQRFVREAKVASGLTNPHIVKVQDYGATRDIHYLVMEYIDGQDLKEILSERGHLPWQEAFLVARQVCLALDHAFQFGIVHRDIKPQNLMMAEGGVVKVLDFGIARALTMPSLTLTGFVGSPYYISPEQAKGEQVDIRSDIYSLGIVIFEMLTGRVPFDADNPWAIISQHIESAPPSPCDWDAEIPPEVGDLVLTAMSKAPEARFQTPLLMLEAIDAMLAKAHGIPETESPTSADFEREIASRYEQGTEAAQHGDWVQALQAFSHVAEVAPDFQDTQAQLSRAELQARLQELYSAAADAMREGHWKEASSALQKILAQDASYRDAPELLVQVDAVLSVSAGDPAPPVEIAEQATPEQPEMEPVEHVSNAPLPNSVTVVSPRTPKTLEHAQLATETTTSPRRWVLGVLILILLGSVFVIGGLELLGRQRTQDIHSRYSRAVRLYETGKLEEAIQEIDRVLAMAPGYEDAALIKEKAVTEYNMVQLYEEGRTEFEAGNFADAIMTLAQLRSQGITFERDAVDRMLCDAYFGQATELSQQVDVKNLQGAIALLDKALEICPANTEILAEKKLMDDYLQVAIDLRDGQWNQVLEELNAIEPAEKGTHDARLDQLFYLVYYDFGKKREAEGNTSAALLHYKKALAVPGIDHGELAAKVAELEREVTGPTPTPYVPPKATGAAEAAVTPTPTPTPAAQETSRESQTTVVRYYSAPKLIGPPDGTVFTSGEYERIILEWEGPGELAKDEYYDVTVLHFFDEQEIYWGTNTQETQLQLSPTIGYGRADKDIFHWFVTIRRAESIDAEGKPDGPPISLRSDAWTFYWR